MLPLIESALAPFAPRPHWGKLHRFDAARIAAVHPRLADARAVFERLDPDGESDRAGGRSRLRQTVGPDRAGREHREEGGPEGGEHRDGTGEREPGTHGILIAGRGEPRAERPTRERGDGDRQDDDDQQPGRRRLRQRAEDRDPRDHAELRAGR